jgi:predicted SprT family Zn-dependent metalloprotease
MKKSHKFDELSDRVCAQPGCPKLIKARFADSEKIEYCYECHCRKEAARAHFVNSNPRKKRIVAGLPVKSF